MRRRWRSAIHCSARKRTSPFTSGADGSTWSGGAGRRRVGSRAVPVALLFGRVVGFGCAFAWTFVVVDDVVFFAFIATVLLGVVFAPFGGVRPLFVARALPVLRGLAVPRVVVVVVVVVVAGFVVFAVGLDGLEGRGDMLPRHEGGRRNNLGRRLLSSDGGAAHKFVTAPSRGLKGHRAGMEWKGKKGKGRETQRNTEKDRETQRDRERQRRKAGARRRNTDTTQAVHAQGHRPVRTSTPRRVSIRTSTPCLPPNGEGMPLSPLAAP